MDVTKIWNRTEKQNQCNAWNELHNLFEKRCWVK